MTHDTRKTMFHVNLDRSQKHALSQLAIADGNSVASHIRTAVSEYLAKHRPPAERNPFVGLHVNDPPS